MKSPMRRMRMPREIMENMGNKANMASTDIRDILAAVDVGMTTTK